MTAQRIIRVLSLGAGVQSTTLLLMSCDGLLPKLDAAVFADTQWEHPDTYAHLDWLTERAAAAGIPVHRVTAGNLREHTRLAFVRAGKSGRYASLPLFVRTPNRPMGRIKRQCTRDYKIDPVQRFVRRTLLGLKPGRTIPKGVAVNQWLGYSSDEIRRVRADRTPGFHLVYPLIEAELRPGGTEASLDRAYSRRMCLDWLAEHYPKLRVPRSSCLGCPNHTNAEWRAIKERPDLWADVCEVDRAIRHADKMDGTVYLHRSCVPLEEADLRDDRAHGQEVFGFVDTCLGPCNT